MQGWPACFATFAVCLVIAAPALGAFPGANGRIAVAGGCNMWSISSDGVERQQLTFEPCPGRAPGQPDWSPDGTKIAYVKLPDLFVMNADGSGNTNITDSLPNGWESDPSWSPDGTRIAFTYSEEVSDGIERHVLIANADGTNMVPLETTLCESLAPMWHPGGARIAFFGATTVHWSPDGSKVVFPGAIGPNSQFVVQAADGSSPPEPFSSDQADGKNVKFSPDGTQLVFRASYSHPESIYTVSKDGSGITEIWPFPATDVAWQPIPINAYPRPKAASPTRVSLVVAYDECTAPDRVHGPPLEHPSCADPVSTQSSPNLWVGTPEVNGGSARFTGVVRIGVSPGDPSTPADEADVPLAVLLHDVRCRPTGAPICGDPNSAGPPDFAGELEARVSLRITDRDNTPHPGGPGPATTVDFPYAFTIRCTGNPDAFIGSDCRLNTTADALVPGTVKERMRAIWQVGQIEVFDGGPDGDVDTPADAHAFLRQGLFVP